MGGEKMPDSKPTCTYVATILLAVGLYSSSTAGQSSTVDPNDVKVIQNCLKATANKPRNECIGKVFNLCAPNPDKLPMQAQSACVAREYQAWDAVLDATYQQLSVQIDANAKPKLAGIQSSWKTARQLTCDFFGVAHAGDLAGMRVNSCYETETANRVYLILDMLNLF
jgi:uncharacterized protein YecT (DUF1311 family)